MCLETTIPPKNSDLRQKIYKGAIYCLPASAHSLELAARVYLLLEKVLGVECRQAQFRMQRDEFVKMVGKVKKTIYAEDSFHELVRAVIAQTGFDLDECAFDPPRIRAVPHGTHTSSAAYILHRDTWLANPVPSKLVDSAS